MAEHTVAELTKSYITVRDALNVKRKEFKEVEKKYKSLMETIGLNLKVHLDAQGVNSIAGDYGTAFKKTKDRTPVQDWDAFLDYVVSELADGNRDVLAFFKKEAMKTVVTQYMSDNEDALPPGIGFESTIEVQVRSAG